MALGRVPGLRLDRSGIALIAATALVSLGAVAPEQALRAIDFPTLLILFGLMIVSAQVAEAGFYDWCAGRIAATGWGAAGLLGLVVVVSGALAAVLSNDVVVFAMAPLLCEGIARRGLDPRPFILALAGAANAGSAATAIGNPQNILIAQAGTLDFTAFLLACLPPTLASLAVVWLVIWLGWRGRWSVTGESTGCSAVSSGRLDRPMMIKAVVAVCALLVLFLTPIPQAVSCCAVAAVLLVSRRLSSHRALALVDWHLLVLFAALFIVTKSLTQTAIPGLIVTSFETWGLSLHHLAGLSIAAVLGSNTIGNVPADMMLLTLLPKQPAHWLYGLALLSTFAGNLLLTGSMANLIAIERAARYGVRISFWDHARCGVVMTVISLGIAVLWLWGVVWP